jgi:uncharacterized protein with HEPN domain
VKNERSPIDSIRDILDASAQIAQFMRGMTLEDFSTDIGVNTKIVWKTATEDLLAIEPKLREMLDELG